MSTLAIIAITVFVVLLVEALLCLGIWALASLMDPLKWD